ncbi:transcriptional regulator MntR, partial [Bacillus thuringiensis]|nr:transcriptional regulator MntR [Bacillus thuringiensis]
DAVRVETLRGVQRANEEKSN